MVEKSDPARTTDARDTASEVASPKEFALIWLTGTLAGTSLELPWARGEALPIGRDAECAIHLANTDVSRQHATLQRSAAEPGVFIADQDSRNGTRVNGKKVRRARLRENDVLRVGGCVFAVSESGAQAFSEVAPGLLGGAALARALAPLARAAHSDLPIVLEGETGTGKEVVARAIHTLSGRSGKLVAINCAALPEGLAEAELFGYRRGAFTGAERASPGFFRSAEGGTLLLDEVSDLPLALQAKLLRALEQRAVQPLGEAVPVPIDVRVVVAGQSSLFEAVKRQEFRADLLARLNGVTLYLPPLRERRADVALLFTHFLRELRPDDSPELEPEFVERLVLHDWPFNVREVLQLARRLAVLQGAESVLRVQHLPREMRLASAVSEPAHAAPGVSVAALATVNSPQAPVALELASLLAALQANGGNVTRAAAQLGVTRQRAYRLLEEQAVDLATLSGQRRPKR
ncbi:MAG TPA: sigma 54-interacting transcriptional regulator [Polyangiaceae bacterium]|nr:sigma 54-interacting transcriptional regulator [Polyangiaceae bacterium]